MTTPAPTAKAMPIETALAELRVCAGTQFDPLVTATLAEISQT